MGSDSLLQHLKELLDASKNSCFGYHINKADVCRLSHCIEFDVKMTTELVKSLSTVAGHNHPVAVFLRMELISAALQRNEVDPNVLSKKVSSFIEALIKAVRHGPYMTFLTQVLEVATILEMHCVKYSWKQDAINLSLRAIRVNGTGEMIDKAGMEYLAALIECGSVDAAQLLMPSLVETLAIKGGHFHDCVSSLLLKLTRQMPPEIRRQVMWMAPEREMLSLDFCKLVSNIMIRSKDFSVITKAKKWNNMKVRLTILKLLVECDVGQFAPLILEDPNAHLGYCVVTYPYLDEEVAEATKKNWIERLGDRQFCLPSDFKTFLSTCTPFTTSELDKMLEIMMGRYQTSPRFLEHLLESSPGWAVTKIPGIVEAVLKSMSSGPVQDQDWVILDSAFEVLEHVNRYGEVDYSAVIPCVRKLLHHNVKFVQIDAISFIAKHAPACALEEITLLALSDCDPDCRLAAMEALLANFELSIRLKDTFLKRLICDLDPSVRLKAIQFAGKLIEVGGSISEDAKKILDSRDKNDDDDACRQAAAVALGEEETHQVERNEADEILVELLEKVRRPGHSVDDLDCF